MTTKTCTKCGEEKDIEQFGVSAGGRRPDGTQRPAKRRAACRPCVRARDREKKRSRASVQIAARRPQRTLSSPQTVEQEFRLLKPWPWPPGAKVFEDVTFDRQIAA